MTLSPEESPEPENPALGIVYRAMLDHDMTWAGPDSQDWTCPAHDDQNPSLGIKAGDEQPVVLMCQAGCTYEEVLAAIGLTPSDLAIHPPQPPVVASPGERAAGSRVFGYTDADNVPVFVVVKLIRSDGSKTFRQYAVVPQPGVPLEDQKAWKLRRKSEAHPRPMDGVERVLWDLPGVIAQSAARGEVIVTEGEKSALIAEAHGRFSTTAPGGAKAKWLDSYTDALRGSSLVTVVADRDPNGFGHAAKVRGKLTAAGIPVRVVASATTGAKDDLEEHFAAGYDWDDLVKLDDDALAPDDLREEVDSRKRQLLVNKLATQEFNSEQAAAGWAAKSIDTGSLADMLDRDDPPEPWLVEGLQKLAHNGALAAQYKTGKTTFALSFAKSIADGEPFLGRRTFLPDGATVGWINGEMDPADFNDYAGPLRIAHPDRIHVMHARGVAVPILDDAVAEHVVRWLADNKAAAWVVDSWRRLCAWSGVDENTNADVERLTARVDEIKRDAGVGAFLTLAHTGRAEQVEGAERARGATALDDWVDVRWVMTKAADVRFLAVEGRVEGMPSTALVYDLATNSISLGEGNRRDVARTELAGAAVAVVTARPGQTTTNIAADLDVSSKHTSQLTSALRGAEIEGLVYHRDKKPRGRNWYPGARPADVHCECEWAMP